MHTFIWFIFIVYDHIYDDGALAYIYETEKVFTYVTCISDYYYYYYYACANLLQTVLVFMTLKKIVLL